MSRTTSRSRGYSNVLCRVRVIQSSPRNRCTVFFEVEQAIHLLMSQLYNPSSGVNPECSRGIDTRICGYERIPRTISFSVEEQCYFHLNIIGFDGGVVVAARTNVLDGLDFYELLDDVRSEKTANGDIVFGLSQLDHTTTSKEPF